MKTQSVQKFSRWQNYGTRVIIFHVQLMERNAKTDSPIQLGQRVMALVSPIRRPSLELQRERERERFE